jgi:hypothetical protein
MGPTSGFEPVLDMKAWNTKDPLRESHNCFAYAMNAVDGKLIQKCKDDPECNVGFHQPGYASGFKRFSEQKEKGCGDMVSRVWGDNPKIVASSFYEKCPYKTSKIALIVDPKRDYHFLRQDPDGYWSHKPGAMDVTRKDASGRPILRPDRAFFLYTKHKQPLMYTRFCGYFCVPRGKPIHMMTDVRRGGSAIASIASNVASHSASLQPSRYQATRRRSRGERDSSTD